MKNALLLLLILLLQQSGLFSLSKPASAPPPVLPVPTAAQIKWQRREIIMFHHFGINTFTNSEWGTGHESPSLFAPSHLNASQWISAAADAGASLVILTAKHHDGFCLWPSRYTRHSVARSPWRGGKGDVVREFAAAASARGIDVGIYLSPWDRHEKTYGLDAPYNEHYLGQLYELLTGYGSISEIWFDGAKGANATNMTYYFHDWFGMTKQLQGSINIFSDAGPDIRWVGNENGAAGETCWSTINRSSLQIGNARLERVAFLGVLRRSCVPLLAWRSISFQSQRSYRWRDYALMYARGYILMMMTQMPSLVHMIFREFLRVKLVDLSHLLLTIRHILKCRRLTPTAAHHRWASVRHSTMQV